MKAISVKQPWAWLIVHGFKDIENRTWATDFRGEVLIHASKEFDRNALFEHRLAPRIFRILASHADGRMDLLRRGGIVGKCEIIDCVESHKSEWFEGPQGFVLKNPQPSIFYPMQGQLRFFETGISPKVADHA